MIPGTNSKSEKIIAISKKIMGFSYRLDRNTVLKHEWYCFNFQANSHNYLNSCCWEEDGCNANLTLEFPKSSIFSSLGGPNGADNQQNVPLVILMVLLPILGLSICIALAYLVWHRYK